MRPSRLSSVMLIALLAVGCGSNPPAAPPSTSAAAAACTQADGPSADAVTAEIAKLPQAPWIEVMSSHTEDCSLHWTVVTSGDASDSPGQVLFFDRKSPIGTPTPDPRPYITVSAQGNDTAVVQYQWRQAQDPACCPTGAATVRFKVEDGKLKALDPIPNP